MYDAYRSTYDTVGTATYLNLKTFTTDSTIFVSIPKKKARQVIISDICRAHDGQFSTLFSVN